MCLCVCFFSFSQPFYRRKKNCAHWNIFSPLNLSKSLVFVGKFIKTFMFNLEHDEIKSTYNVHGSFYFHDFHHVFRWWKWQVNKNADKSMFSWLMILSKLAFVKQMQIFNIHYFFSSSENLLNLINAHFIWFICLLPIEIHTSATVFLRYYSFEQYIRIGKKIIEI